MTITKLFRKWADSGTQYENARLRARNAELESKLKIQQLELDELSHVITRNLARVKAETAIAGRKIADAEGAVHVTC